MNRPNRNKLIDNTLDFDGCQIGWGFRGMGEKGKD